MAVITSGKIFTNGEQLTADSDNQASGISSLIVQEIYQ